MQGWQRNRFGLAILIFASAIVANIETFSQGQIISLISLFVVIYYLYVIYLNKYKKVMYTTIISSEILNSIIKDKNVIVFDCRFDLMKKDEGYNKYLESHIKGAHYINLELDLSSVITEHSGRHPLQEIEKFTNLLNDYGVNPDSQIIVYDDENNSISARLWWMLNLVGITKCAVLDGGFKDWTQNKFPIDSFIPKKNSKENLHYSYNTNLIVDTQSLKNMLLDKNSVNLVDARDKERFLGKTEPIDTKAGHIPGAINMPFKDNLDKKGKFKEISYLRKNLQKLIILIQKT